MNRPFFEALIFLEQIFFALFEVIYVSSAQLAGLPTRHPWGLREPAATKINLARRKGD
jgi:hypothetical protein